MNFKKKFTNGQEVKVTKNNKKYKGHILNTFGSGRAIRYVVKTQYGLEYLKKSEIDHP